MAVTHDDFMTFLNGEAAVMQPSRRLKVDVSNPTKVLYADAADGNGWIGVSEPMEGGPAAVDAPQTVRLRSESRTVKVETSEAVDDGDSLYPENDGKVSDTAGTVIVGIAHGSVGASGGIVEMIPNAAAVGGYARTGVKYVGSALAAKLGSTGAGWVIDAADDKFLQTLPASQTAEKLIIPVQGLHVGDTITGFGLVGQIESAGGAVTVDGELRKQTAAAADVTDASVGSMTQISVTADTAIDATQDKGSLAEVVAPGETFYIIVTATTAASTDVAISGYSITVTSS